MADKDKNKIIEDITQSDYRWGFVSDIETETLRKGLNEETIRFISAKKGEPQFMLDFRLKAFEIWKKKQEPHWAHFEYPPIDYQDIVYWAAPKSKTPEGAAAAVDPALLETFEKLGISLEEQKVMTGVAVDA
ncbi:MAG: Fe-S cluster assembly protein SufB, partial [Bacteroidales bacterium]|nr:Fe-S cluster assembly protein SufB [Bacteroidales bacterium]